MNLDQILFEALQEAKKKPSAGLTKKQKSAVAKKAKAGKDIGKKGKGFKDLAKKAAEDYGSKEAGEKVAAAAMWKNIKRESIELNECSECERQRDWTHGHDHEGSMAKSELKDMLMNGAALYRMLGENDELPGWVSAYITLASDYIHSVTEHLAGMQAEEPEQHIELPAFAVYETKDEE